MKAVEKAYLAGIVDGEGTVTLAKHHRNETPVPYVAIANNNLEMLKWVKTRAGGIIIHKRRRLVYHKESYAWSVRQARALRFLKDIRPFLIVKKQQASLILGKYKTVTHRAGKYTPELLRRKMMLVAMIRKLNQRATAEIL